MYQLSLVMTLGRGVLFAIVTEHKNIGKEKNRTHFDPR